MWAFQQPHQMNSTLYVVLLTLMLGVGCGGGEKEKSQSPLQSENTQQEENQNTDEVANKLFDEAMQLIREGEVASADFHTSDFHERALAFMFGIFSSLYQHIN